MTLRVLCVKWGDKYSDEYVKRLHSMAFRFLPPHTFVCITESSVEGIACHPLCCDLPGWWQKVGLFQPGLFPGEKLYLDLDVVLTAPIVLPKLEDKVWTLDDFSYSLAKPKAVDPHTARLLGGAGTVNSSVMYWRDDVGSDVWTKFTPAVMKELHGDQNWITRCLWPQEISLFPKGFACSYKYRQIRNEPMAPICVFHGQPKVTDLSRNDPLRLAWC